MPETPKITKKMREELKRHFDQRTGDTPVIYPFTSGNLKGWSLFKSDTHYYAMRATDLVGKGTFGSVYKAYQVNEHTGLIDLTKPHVIKEIITRLPPSFDSRENDNVKSEVELLSQNRYKTEPLVSLPYQQFHRILGWSKENTRDDHTFEITRVAKQDSSDYEIQIVDTFPKECELIKKGYVVTSDAVFYVNKAQHDQPIVRLDQLTPTPETLQELRAHLPDGSTIIPAETAKKISFSGHTPSIYNIVGQWSEKGRLVQKPLDLADFKDMSLPMPGDFAKDKELVGLIQSKYGARQKHYIVTEYINGTALIEMTTEGDVLHKKLKKASVGKRVDVIVQLLDQLNSFHHSRPYRDNPMVHRDLGGNNILFDGKSAVIIDFGLAKHVEHEDGKLPIPEEYSREGGHGNRAPENLAKDKGTSYADFNSDFYAMTPVIAVLLGAKNPYGEKDNAYHAIKVGGQYKIRLVSLEELNERANVPPPNTFFFHLDTDTQILSYRVISPSGKDEDGTVNMAELSGPRRITTSNETDQWNQVREKGTYYNIFSAIANNGHATWHGSYFAQKKYVIDDMLKGIYPKKYPQDLAPIIVKFVNRMQSRNPEDKLGVNEPLQFFTSLSRFIKAHTASERWFLNKHTKAVLKKQMTEARVEMALIERGIDVERYFRKLPDNFVVPKRLEDIIYGKKYPQEIKAFVFEFLKRMQNKDRVAETQPEYLEKLTRIQARAKQITDRVKDIQREDKKIQERMAVLRLLVSAGSGNTKDDRQRHAKLKSELSDKLQAQAALKEEHKQLWIEHARWMDEINAVKDTTLELKSFFETLNHFCDAYDNSKDLGNKYVAHYHLEFVLKANEINPDLCDSDLKRAISKLIGSGMLTQDRVALLISESKEEALRKQAAQVADDLVTEAVLAFPERPMQAPAVIQPSEQAVPVTPEEPVALEDKVVQLITDNREKLRAFTANYKRAISPTLFHMGRSHFGKDILDGKITDFKEIEDYAKRSHGAARRAMDRMQTPTLRRQN